jgi:uncharacterized protein (TIGR02145 family)
MKNKTLIYPVLLAGILTVLLVFCKKGKEAAIPKVSITKVEYVVGTSAALQVEIMSNGGAAIKERGICWNTIGDPVITENKTQDRTGLESFFGYITGLNTSVTYYVRAYAINSAGIGYSSQSTIKTLDSDPMIPVSANPILFNQNLSYGTVTDIDGNVYKTIKIGYQTWMAENLKTTKYRNGDPISYLTDNTKWSNSTTGAYCWYNNDESLYKEAYGALYNWYALNDSRNIAPTGWHVATQDEWKILIISQGGITSAGSKLKEAGSAHWLHPNTGANNESGFTALPGGSRDSGGRFSGFAYEGFWHGFSQKMEYDYIFFNDIVCEYLTGTFRFGFSVRCVKN